MDKDKPDFADFVMNLPTSGSRGAAAWEGNFSRIYIWKQNTGQALSPRAAQTGMRPRGLQLQAGQACPAATLLEAEPKAPAHFSQVAQARHCWPLAGRSPHPPKHPWPNSAFTDGCGTLLASPNTDVPRNLPSYRQFLKWVLVKLQLLGGL